MLYIDLNGRKEYLDSKIVEKYGLKPGMRTPFTQYKIFEDEKKEISAEKKTGNQPLPDIDSKAEQE